MWFDVGSHTPWKGKSSKRINHAMSQTNIQKLPSPYHLWEMSQMYRSELLYAQPAAHNGVWRTKAMIWRVDETISVRFPQRESWSSRSIRWLDMIRTKVKGPVIGPMLVELRRTNCNEEQVIVCHAAEVELGSANFRKSIWARTYNGRTCVSKIMAEKWMGWV